jgi:hypothetical protein
MRSSVKRFSLPVAAIALASGVSSLKADTSIQYYTAGVFGNDVAGASAFVNGTPSSAGSVSTDTVGQTTLTFTGAPETPFGITLPSVVSLGSFGVGLSSLTQNQLDAFGNVDFTLYVYQASPAGGPGTLAAELDGHVSTSSSSPTTVNDTLNITFVNPPTIFVTSSPEIEYQITNDDKNALGVAIPGRVNVGLTLPVGVTAYATAMPLPATASTGLALLGGLGVLGGVNVLRRRRQMA